MTDAVTPIVRDLEDLLGADCVLTATADIERYLVESRGLYRGAAAAVVRPRDTRGVADAVAYCARNGISIVALGGNTGLVGGGVPQGGIVISLERLSGIVDLDTADGTITVQAGVTLQRVQQAAEDAGYLFPLSLAAEGSCTIGGNVATNAGGTAVLRYGNVRALVLGLEVVLADGRVLDMLTRLHKDNAGYDLKHLFIGSEGTLGIVTAVVLKLFPRPKHVTTAFVGGDDLHRIFGMFERIRNEFADALVAFELVPHNGLDLVYRHMSGSARALSGDHAWYALVELASPSEKLALGSQLEEALADAIENDVIADAVLAATESQRTALWALRENLAEAQRCNGPSIKHDISLPLSSIMAFIDETTAACEAELEGAQVCVFGHLGDGNLHFNILPPPEADPAVFLATTERFNRIVHDRVRARRGSIAAEHGVGMLKVDELTRYKDGLAIEVMRAVKQSLDPQGILNPGKVLKAPAVPNPDNETALP